MWHWDPAFIHWLQKPDPAEWLGAIFTGTAASFGVRAYGMQVRDRRERTSADRRRQAERVWVTEPTPTEWRRNDGVDIFSSVVVHNASDLPVDYVSVVMTARLYERQEPRPNLGIGISDGFEQSPMLDDREPPGWDPTSLRWRRYNVGRMAPNRETKPITVYIPVDDIGHDDEGQEWLWTVRLEFVDAVGRKWMRGGRGPARPVRDTTDRSAVEVAEAAPPFSDVSSRTLREWNAMTPDEWTAAIREVVRIRQEEYLLPSLIDGGEDLSVFFQVGGTLRSVWNGVVTSTIWNLSGTQP